MDYLYAFASIASAVAAVLAWVAKIYWSKEHKAANDELIRTKDALISLLQREIDGLKELTPMKIREYFTSVKSQLEEYNDTLKTQIEEARREISEKKRNIETLMASGSQQKGEIEKLTAQKQLIEKNANNLEVQLSTTKSNQIGSAYHTLQIPYIDSSVLKQITLSSEALRNSLTHGISTIDIATLSTSISDSMAIFSTIEKLKISDPLLMHEVVLSDVLDGMTKKGHE